MGRKLCSEGKVHGCPASGLGVAGNSVVGTTTKFSGDSKAAVSKGDGSDSWKKVGDVGMKSHKTGGMSRKNAGVVGAGKASGTK